MKDEGGRMKGDGEVPGTASASSDTSSFIPHPSSFPGTVFWCDGPALAFEAHFKRRPVLVLAVQEDGDLLVLPLSSKRRYGQETAVTHLGGVSYITGQMLVVPVGALRKSLGEWEGFAAWRAEQEAAAEAAERFRIRWLRLRRWLLPRTR